ncbi:MAG: RNA 2',3'-cyclic phosphodiesterase [Candidatus Izemoplasmatales bacterium]|jgi:2'-5' RNA ligase
MRLFLAIVPDQRAINKIYPQILKFKEHAHGGNFTSAGNLHLTVVFIGEVDDAGCDRLKRIVNSISFDPFIVKTRQIGFFANRGANDILVWHLDPTKELIALCDSVRHACLNEGFVIDQRQYRPHFTLARKVRWAEGFLNRPDALVVPTVHLRSERLSLMESIRLDGRLVYREIHGKTMAPAIGQE